MALTDFVKTQTGKEVLSGATRNSRQVFGRYLYEGELGILFGDSNAGKSILANDIAFFVCGGGHVWSGMESPKIPSLYIDMELTQQQFADRYRTAGDYMTDDYQRTEVNVLMSAENKLFSAIRTEIILQQAKPKAPKFIFIDNITNGFGSIFSASKMRGLVSELKTLKDRFGLTILIIAHCPKRKQFTPITDNDMGGSKMLINFCDSAFAIAPSRQGSDIKYIKQIKTRASEKITDVLSVKITSEPYLSMKPLGMTDEDSHLNPSADDALITQLTAEMEIELVKMLNDGNMSFSEIAEALNIKRDIVVDYAIQYDL